MRVQEIISKYGNQAYDHSKNRNDFRKFSLKPLKRTNGCVDMISFSSKIEDSDQSISDLETFVHLIPEEAMNDWIKKTYYDTLSREDVIVEKLLIEIF
jgi:hypothetical protein